MGRGRPRKYKTKAEAWIAKQQSTQQFSELMPCWHVRSISTAKHRQQYAEWLESEAARIAVELRESNYKYRHLTQQQGMAERSTVFVGADFDFDLTDEEYNQWKLLYVRKQRFYVSIHCASVDIKACVAQLLQDARDFISESRLKELGDQVLVLYVPAFVASCWL